MGGDVGGGGEGDGREGDGMRDAGDIPSEPVVRKLVRDYYYRWCETPLPSARFTSGYGTGWRSDRSTCRGI